MNTNACNTFWGNMAYLSVTSLVIAASLHGAVITGYKHIFFTPAGEKFHYYLMDDYGHSIHGQNSFVFQVQACCNVHILLMKDRHDFRENIYEINIGEGNNTQAEIRKQRSGSAVAAVITGLLDCNKLQTFRISWDKGTVRGAVSTSVGYEDFLTFTDDSLLPVSFFSISTGYPSSGHWIFESTFFTTECCSYEARDCQDILGQGEKSSGVYNVTPAGLHNTFDVYCNLNGGWLVFQRRIDGSEDFYRNWHDYKFGFGQLSGEFWLGNDHLHDIVSQGQYELRIELEDFDGNSRFASYATFYVGDSSENYKLTVGEYSGDAGDSLAYHQGRGFSTKDAGQASGCATKYKGAWWYNSCHHSNLNGLYLNGSQTSYADGVNWEAWKGYRYSLKRAEMMIRRK